MDSGSRLVVRDGLLQNFVLPGLKILPLVRYQTVDGDSNSVFYWCLVFACQVESKSRSGRVEDENGLLGLALRVRTALARDVLIFSFHLDSRHSTHNNDYPSSTCCITMRC
jgi:hypothetical protein